MRSIAAISLLCLGLLPGSVLADLPRAKVLETDVADEPAAHAVLLRPDEAVLPFRAFLVGIEESRMKTIGAARSPDLELRVGTTSRAYFGLMLGSQWKRMFVSHLVEFARQADPAVPGFQPTTVYSAYREDDLPRTTDAFEAGRLALTKSLPDRLERAANEIKATHLLVFATGWNTRQLKTLSDLKALDAALRKAAGPKAEFRPLWVAVSWPSESERLGPAFGKTTYPTKSNDADEVGLLWAGTLVNQVLVPLRERLPAHPKVVVIGHSFGARIAAWSAFSGGIRPKDGDPVCKGPDCVLGLQGAFALRRFLPGQGVEGTPYERRPAGTRFVFTCSDKDQAYNALAAGQELTDRQLRKRLGFVPGLESVLGKTPEAQFRVQMIGSREAFQYAADYSNTIRRHAVAGAEGRWTVEPELPAEAGRVILVDASPIVGGHNDVRNDGMGWLVWTAIR